MMKKLFTGASAALAGLLLASPAAAQGEAETMMSLGGFTQYTVSFTKHPNGQLAEQEGDIEVFNSTEIFFNGSAETDGGLQVSARVELEGASNVDGNDQIDEHYITVSGGFGSVEVGANDGADERTATGVFYNNTGVSYIYWDAMTVPNGAGYRGVGTFSDGMGVTYSTPNLGGVGISVGYKPSREGDESNPDSVVRGSSEYGDEDVLTIGANYHGEADGISFTGSIGYGTLEEDGGDDSDITHKNFGVGVKLGFGDTTLYGRFEDNEVDPDGDVAATETTQYSVAISHSIGPVRLGLGWVQQTRDTPQGVGIRGVDDDGEAITVADDTVTGNVLENEDTMLLGSVDYSLGSGVVIAAYLAWGETEQTGTNHRNLLAATAAVVDDTNTPDIDETAAAQDPRYAAGDTGAAQDKAGSADGTAFGIALNLAF